MRIGILKVDRVHEELVEIHQDYDHMFRQLLNTIRPQWQINSYDVINGILPQDVTACDGYLITGSQYSTYDDLPWIPALEDFIRQCHQHQKNCWAFASAINWWLMCWAVNLDRAIGAGAWASNPCR